MAEQAKEETSFDILSNLKTLGKKTIKPLVGAATVGAGYGAGHAVRWGLEEGLEQGLNGALQGAADYAPLGGAALGAVFAPVTAEKAEELILSKPRVISTVIDGEEHFVVANLPHLDPQPRIYNTAGDVVVEGVKVAEIEAMAYGKNPSALELTDEFDPDTLGGAARRELKNAREAEKAE